MENKIMQLVTAICNTQSSNCRGLDKAELGKELLYIASVPSSANIQEIPLDWNNQVVILFLLPNDSNYYSLFAGIGTDKKFHFDLSITGILNAEQCFDFYEEEKELAIDYFKAKQEGTTQEEKKMENLESIFGKRVELETIQLDKIFVVDGNEQFCHSTGYEVQDDDGSWWNEYQDRNGDFHYGR